MGEGPCRATQRVAALSHQRLRARKRRQKRRRAQGCGSHTFPSIVPAVETSPRPGLLQTSLGEPDEGRSGKGGGEPLGWGSLQALFLVSQDLRALNSHTQDGRVTTGDGTIKLGETSPRSPCPRRASAPRARTQRRRGFLAPLGNLLEACAPRPGSADWGFLSGLTFSWSDVCFSPKHSWAPLGIVLGEHQFHCQGAMEGTSDRSGQSRACGVPGAEGETPSLSSVLPWTGWAWSLPGRTRVSLCVRVSPHRPSESPASQAQSYGAAAGA